MKSPLPVSLVIFALACGCATKRSDTAFQEVPPPTHVDASLGSLATASGKRVYAEKDELKKMKPAKKPKKSKGDQPVVTPDTGLQGKVVTYNEPGRFTIVSFPLGQMPAMGRLLFVYRGGLKVGQIKITGPQREDKIVADLVEGESKAGDEVRDK